ncbi:hypothetical protein [Mycolicibacter senuensis]|uniref:hypothetical protein n=1 Tax=Mycolicibacter senuensis TaxID=386913 RepID=UPI00105762D6|nr:hypothetical protein [Mycolicibacter senuensis]
MSAPDRALACRARVVSDTGSVTPETLFDLLDATQSAGVLPSDHSWLFRALLGASKPAPAGAERRPGTAAVLSAAAETG